MKTIFLLIVIAVLVSCRNDASYKQNAVVPARPGAIDLALTGRVGAVVGDELTKYVKSLNLFLFREDGAGKYYLFRSVALTKAQLEALSVSAGGESGFTEPKLFTFDTVPVANYKIVGIGNAIDSAGGVLPYVKLQGVVIGNDPSQILASVSDGEQSSRMFLGMTGTIQVGAIGDNRPVLSLYRKVSMFALTLEKIPNVVDRIDMEIGNTYGKFDMNGAFVPGSDILVFDSSRYQQQVQDSITLTYVTLPTVSGDSSSLQATFYIVDGPKQVVSLPKYVLKPNTITKVTATIDTDQPGDRWKVDVTTLISVDVEWNVDQEPPITI